MSITGVISLIASLLGISVALLTYKVLFDRLWAAVNAPARMKDFYFLFFWAVVASLLGGVLWGACQQVFPGLRYTPCSGQPDGATLALGGSKEPHGLAAVLWPVVTNLPPVVLLLALAWWYEFIPFRGALLGSLLLIVLLSVASLGFYDAPLQGYRGFRCYLGSRGLGYLEREMYLVMIWSALLSIVPFLGLFCVGRLGWIDGPGRSLIGSCAGAVITMVLTIASVGFFLAAYPDEGLEAGRGIAAGVALRVSLFFGFIVSSSPWRVDG